MSNEPSDQLAYPKPTAPGIYRVTTEWERPVGMADRTNTPPQVREPGEGAEDQ